MPHRIERLNAQIQQVLSDSIRHHVKDPRIGSLISITEVSLAPDLKNAKVYVSCICDEKERQETLTALNGAAHFFRKEMTKTLQLRHMPELMFLWDDTIERADRLMQLLDQVHREEKPKS